MRKPRQMLHALALAAALTTTAHAAAPVPVQYVDPSGNPITVRNGALGLPTREQFPVGAAYDFKPMVISTIFHNGLDSQNGGIMTNRDSTIVFDMRGYNHAALIFWPSPTADADVGQSNADSLGAAVFAVQPRIHATALSDTNNTGFASRTLQNAAALGQRDTIGSLADVSYNVTGTPGVNGCNRQILLPGERPVVVTNFGQRANRAIVIWASDRADDTQQASGLAPFMSWRMRFIRAYRVASMALNSDSLFTSATQQYSRMRGRVDLVRWWE